MQVLPTSTSELYGKVLETPQTEETPFYQKPYAVTKLYAYWISVNYGKHMGFMHATEFCLIMKAPGEETFVTRKITRGLSRISVGLEDCLYLGNLDALRDWGHARDYVEMQWLMLQQDEPEDFVIATGRQESVRRFVELTAKRLGFGINWQGSGLQEVGIRDDTEEIVVRIDPRYFRPTEVETLLGDPTKAKEKLGWSPRITLEAMVSEMVDHDLETATNEKILAETRNLK